MYKSRSSSGAEVNDLNPEQQYDVDLRYFDEEERELGGDLANEGKQSNVRQFLKSTKAADLYRKKKNVEAPYFDQRYLRNSFFGPKYGPAGGVSHGRSPEEPTTPSFSFFMPPD